MTNESHVITLRGTRVTRCTTCPRYRQCFGRNLGGHTGEIADKLTVATRLLHRGDKVYFGGQPCRGLFIIKSGRVKTLLVSEHGEEQITGFPGPGEILGADGLSMGSYQLDAIALDTVSVCTLGLDTASRIDGLPSVLMNMLGAVVASGERRLLMLGKLRAEQRLAAFLLDQARSCAHEGLDRTTFTLVMSRTDIANHLSLALETVSRLFTRFRERRWIDFDRNQVHRLNEAALSRLLEEPDPASSSMRSRRHSV